MKAESRKNSMLHMVDGASFMSCFSLCSVGVMMPAYVRGLTDNAFLLAMIQIIYDLGTTLPQTFSVYYREIRRKPKASAVHDYFAFALITRSSFLLIGLVSLFFLKDQHALLSVFFIFYTLFCVLLGINSPNWVNLVSVSVPDRSRAEFLGKRELVVRIIGILVSLSVPWFLSHPFPMNYIGLFLAGGVIVVLGILPARFYDELYPIETPTIPEKKRDYFQFIADGIRELSRHKKLFRLLLLVWCLSASRIAYPFFTPYVLETVLSKYPAEAFPWYLSLFNFSFLAFMALTGYLGGQLVSRIGHKKTLLLACVSLLTANTLILTVPCFIAAIISQFFLALFFNSVYFAGLNALMDFSPPEFRPLVSSMNNTVNSLFILFSALLGSVIVFLFGKAAVLLVVSVFAAGMTIFILRTPIRAFFKKTRRILK